MVFCTDAAGHEDAWRWEVFHRFSWSYFAYILFYLPLVLHQPLPIICGIFMLFSFLFLQPCCSIPFLLPCSSLVLHPFPTTGTSSPPPYLSIGDRLLEFFFGWWNSWMLLYAGHPGVNQCCSSCKDGEGHLASVELPTFTLPVGYVFLASLQQFAFHWSSKWRMQIFHDTSDFGFSNCLVVPVWCWHHWHGNVQSLSRSPQCLRVAQSMWATVAAKLAQLTQLAVEFKVRILLPPAWMERK